MGNKYGNWYRRVFRTTFVKAKCEANTAKPRSLNGKIKSRFLQITNIEIDIEI